VTLEQRAEEASIGACPSHLALLVQQQQDAHRPGSNQFQHRLVVSEVDLGDVDAALSVNLRKEGEWGRLADEHDEVVKSHSTNA
jgi:hypothetical protein